MFELLQTDPESKARRGRLTTAHGVIETPIFMPVGTQGTVKAVSQEELAADLDASIILGNTPSEFAAGLGSHPAIWRAPRFHALAAPHPHR